MSKKVKHLHTEMSNKKCKVCNSYLKLNLVEKNPDADKCYNHYMQLDRKNPRYSEGKRNIRIVL